jgi:hypothetical protein
MTKFHAKVVPIKGGGHYLVVPEDVADKAKLKYGVRVRGTIEGTAYRSSLMKYSGVFHMGVHKATLAAANAKAGDTVAVTIEIDDAPLPGDTLPPELAKTMKADAALKAAWEKLAPSHRREHVKYINEAKKAETRAARVGKTIASLKR